jgi:hypothetical protein
VKVLLHLVDLRVGGAQHAALDLAVGLQAAGHDVVLATGPGPLEPLVPDRGLRRVGLPGGRHPSRAVTRALGPVVAAERPDVILSFGAWAALEAVAAAPDVPVVAWHPSASLPPESPRTTPVIARRQAVLDAARGRNPFVADLPAPVDPAYNHPDVEPADLGPGPVVDLATRLVREQKAAGIELAIRAAAGAAWRLVIVGDGGLRPDVEAWVDELGGGAVTLVDEVADPRPLYAAADVVLGLGTSVLRGMAMGRPAVVLGPEGQAMPVDELTVPALRATGWLAVGEPATPDQLSALIEAAMADPGDARAEVVAERDPAVIVPKLVPVLERAVREHPSRRAVRVDVARSWATWAVRKYGGRWYRRGRWHVRRLRSRLSAPGRRPTAVLDDH